MLNSLESAIADAEEILDEFETSTLETSSEITSELPQEYQGMSEQELNDTPLNVLVGDPPEESLSAMWEDTPNPYDFGDNFYPYRPSTIDGDV